MKTIEIIDQRISFDKDISKYYDLLLSCIKDKKVLIIGGAGTIGSNYIKEMLVFKPKKIVVVDFNENGLTELTRDLRSSELLNYNPIYITYPINLLDDIFDKVYKSENFDIVANFSAHKHVRSEKDKFSVEALIKNNVYGCIKLLNLCLETPPRYFFSVSTDKAANPVNIMGASKSLMEKCIISKKDIIRVSTARFANVAFSNGSLLDGFIHRVNKKQPLSCPNDIKRFFVTPKQSGQICLLSTFLGESGNIFFPKLDFNIDQIYFKDLAIKFLEKNNLKPVIFNDENSAKKYKIKSDEYYPILFFQTDTSGEKPYEEFYSDKENYFLNIYNSLGLIKPSRMELNFKDILEDFENIFENPDSTKKDIVKVIIKYILDFDHIETGKSLDNKM